MRKAKTPLALTLLVALCATTAGCSGSEAACASEASYLEASPARASPGEPFRLHGEGFYGEFVCNDQGPSFLSGPNGGRPTAGIRIELAQGAKTWPLATVSSDEDLSFDARRLRVPADAAPGEAVVRATSPTVEDGTTPSRAETPFLVLDPGDRPGERP